MRAAWRRRSVGVGIAAIGMGAVAMSAQLQLGTLRNLGPGAFPLTVAATLTIIGLAMAVLKDGEPTAESSPQTFWSALQVLIAVLIFGTSVERAGLFAASVMLITLSSFDEARRRPFDTALLAIVLALGAAAVFVGLLGLPMSILPPALGLD
jgi:hypothetical protein